MELVKIISYFVEWLFVQLMVSKKKKIKEFFNLSF
jgi:hypothetical protein